MISTMRKARVAGLLYLIFVVAGFFDLYVSSTLIVAGDASKTISNILNNQLLYRIDTVDNLLSSPIWIAVAIALYMLLEGVNKKLSTLMVILVLVQVPTMFLNVANQLFALEFAKGVPLLASFSETQRESLGSLMLHINGLEDTAAELLWGLWLFPLGVLVYKSRFLPRFLGIWLNLNGIAYVVMSFIGILAPEYLGLFNKFAFPLLLGEVAFTLWLLIVGARGPQQNSPGERDKSHAAS